MGQAQSDENSTTTTNTPPPSTNSPRESHGDDTSSPSMGSLLAGSFFSVLCISIERIPYSLYRQVL